MAAPPMAAPATRAMADYREPPFVVDVVVELLRVRGERPNRCRTNKTHEVAPPHVT